MTDDVSLAEAEAYVDELIQSQVLVTGLEVPVTGQEPIHVLVDELLARPETISFARPLASARQELQAIDAAGLGVPPERYRAIARTLESLPAKVELPRLFQVDMTKPASAATLGSAVIAEIVAGADLLRRLARPGSHLSLDQFREVFTARYEGREVPLVEALDEEAGIGFEASAETSPLLHDLAFPPLADDSAPTGAREALLIRKLGQALSGSHEEIVLEPGDIETMATREPPPLPRGFAAMATIAAPSEQALNRGRFRVALISLAGPSGRGSSVASVTRTDGSGGSSRSISARRKRSIRTRCSPRSCTCPKDVSATSSCGRSCVATRSRTWGGRAPHANARSRSWT